MFQSKNRSKEKLNGIQKKRNIEESISWELESECRKTSAYGYTIQWKVKENIVKNIKTSKKPRSVFVGEVEKKSKY